MTSGTSIAVAGSSREPARWAPASAALDDGFAGRAAVDRALRAAVDRALRAAVDRLPESVARIAGFHFGWWDDRGVPIAAHGGKAIRAALVLLASEAVGGSPDAALPGAVAVELIHNFSLIHDDVIDADAIRRHRPAVWAAFGVSSAILTGDALMALAFEELARSGHPATTEALSNLHAAVIRLLEGQTADLEFEQRHEVSADECQRMAAGKTGALLGCATALGALLGGGTRGQVEHLRRFGEYLGLAFQFVDDILGIWGDPAVTGKPVYSDLTSRKKSLPVVYAMASGTAAGERLGVLYARPEAMADAELCEAAALIQQAGGRAWCHNQAELLLASALHELWSDVPPDRAADLEQVARLIVDRDH